MYSHKYINNIVQNLLKDKHKDKTPTLTILYGPPGSGKGTIMGLFSKKSNNNYKLFKNTIVINYDDIIHNNPNFIKERKTSKDDTKLYYKYRKEINKIDNFIHKKILGYNILWETTGANINFMFKWFQMFNDKHYKINIHTPLVFLDTIFNRIKNREKKTGQISATNGQIIKEYSIIYNNLVKLLPYTNNIYLYDNTSKSTIPIVNIRSIYNTICYVSISPKLIKLIGLLFGDPILQSIRSSNICIKKCKLKKFKIL